MVIVLNNVKVNTEDVIKYIDRILNQIFKLLPLREEEQDWETNLDNIIIDVTGLSKVLKEHYNFFALLCKLNSLKDLDFYKFRKIIFECCGHCSEMKKCLV